MLTWWYDVSDGLGKINVTLGGKMCALGLERLMLNLR